MQIQTFPKPISPRILPMLQPRFQDQKPDHQEPRESFLSGPMAGALVGSLIATSNPWDHNGWNGFRRAQMGALVGGAAEGLVYTSPLSGLVLGVGPKGTIASRNGSS